MNCMELVIDYEISLSLKESNCWTNQQAFFCFCGRKKRCLSIVKAEITKVPVWLFSSQCLGGQRNANELDYRQICTKRTERAGSKVDLVINITLSNAQLPTVSSSKIAGKTKQAPI